MLSKSDIDNILSDIFSGYYDQHREWCFDHELDTRLEKMDELLEKWEDMEPEALREVIKYACSYLIEDYSFYDEVIAFSLIHIVYDEITNSVKKVLLEDYTALKYAKILVSHKAAYPQLIDFIKTQLELGTYKRYAKEVSEILGFNTAHEAGTQKF